jgi:porin
MTGERAQFGILVIALALAAADVASADEGEDRIWGNNPSSSIAARLPGAYADARARLSERGIHYGFIYTGEALGNVSGGIRRGAIYEGKLEGYLGLDLQKLLGLKGLGFYANAFQIHGTGGMQRDNVGNIITISNIEALPTTRLSELWLEQKFFQDKASIRFGQLAADTEFFFSNTSRFFINDDWPTIAAANLPNGGPAYPLSTPGVRLKIQPNPDFTFLIALFNGDPGDQATQDRYGLALRMRDPPFVISEMQFRYNQEKDARGLVGSLKIGAWTHFGRFADQRFDSIGLSLASPASSGIAAMLRGDFGVYGVIDQQIYRRPGGGAEEGIAVFSRISASPADRNLVDFYMDGGILFSGMIAARANDKFGASVIFAKISDRARALDLDTIAFTGMPQPVRNFEATLELSYGIQITPDWLLQPIFQYTFHPSGGVPNPNAPGTAIKGAATFGVRTTSRY